MDNVRGSRRWGAFFFIGQIARGHARKRGKRVPKGFSGPRFIDEIDIPTAMEEIKVQYREDTGDENPWFALPDAEPQRVMLEEITKFTPTPMLLGKALAFLRELCADERSGISEED